MKRWIGLILLLVPLSVSAAAFWDGNAALQRGDSTFESGMFAASNSFAENTRITIENLATGKTATATVTGRINGQSDILVLVSPPVAAALGVGQGTLASVRVTIAETPPVAAVAQADRTVSQDPDVNPAVAYAAPAEPSTTETQPAQTAKTAETAQAAPAETPTTETPATTQAATPAESSTTETQPAQTAETTEAAQAAPVETPTTETQPAETAKTTETAQAAPAETPTTETPATTQAAASTTSDDQAIISAAEERAPQKQLFLPPREDPSFALKKPATTEVQAAAPATEKPAETTPAEPQITAVIGEPGVAPAPGAQQEEHLAEATPPEESTAQEIVGTEGAAPKEAPSDTSAVALAVPEPLPAEAPAETQPAVAAAPAEQTPSEPVQTEVTAPAAVPPAAQPPAVVALATPAAPAPEKAPEQAATAPTKPAETKPATPAAETRAPATQPAATAVLPKGKPGTFYLQLGAYAQEKVARDLAATLAPTYPALVLSPTGTGAYRVVIGPLNKAESGTLLTWFRHKGYPDAFLRAE